MHQVTAANKQETSLFDLRWSTDWMLLDHCVYRDKFTLYVGGRYTLGFDIEGWRHQEEEMAWCLREHCGYVPPTQLYRCL